MSVAAVGVTRFDPQPARTTTTIAASADVFTRVGA
jgi:hypothetical protein